MRGSHSGHSKSKKSTQKSTIVEIKVGLAGQTDGVIKLRRGKTQIITVNSLAKKEDIMQKAKAKHASFDQSFDDTLQYTLLYPDFREVVNVPGTNETFQLSTYKQAIGKEFKRLTFYLIPGDDFTDMSDESDSEAIANPAKQSHLCEFFSGASNRDLTGSSDDGNDDKEIREVDRCPCDASESGTSYQAGDHRTERVLYEEFIPPEFQYHPSLHKLCRRTELLQSAPIMALPSRYPAIVLGLFILGIFCTYRFTTWKSKSAKKVAKPQNVAILKKHLPKAIIIGSGKSGTRALLVILKIHPDIKACPKEVNFFNRNENYKQGLDWNRSQMPKSREDQLTVEKSPGYFTSMTVPRRVYRSSKDVKLLVIVRDPTARAISDYTQLALKQNNSLLAKFEDYVTKEASVVDTKRSVVKNGVYINHLRQWLMYLPFSQIHFVSGEGLVQNPAAEIRPVEKYLTRGQFLEGPGNLMGP
ncbi:Heparan sulfate glucosamine 3-O-sulfotransferase 2 [Stylophora pistillata]|uniref:Heparan sulfate glucosamine 3-O-sulfotransferase 2 n=1 Tax=Stylophora pistillata TaxID=50429 RepID=A0A2B4S7R3_STYPI|nr:Heparan sulfate glucosamine 3-O-sulfotransferase 2 [Stylophora pistillata]